MAKKPEAPVGSDWFRCGSDLLSFDGHDVVITKSGGSNKGTFTYAVEQISGIQITKPGPMSLGVFRVVVAGEASPRARQGMLDVARDPFAVQFKKSLMEAAERIAGKVRKAQAELRAPKPAAAAASTPGIGDQLTQLAALHASGALTAEEFAAAKQQLLGTPVVGPQDDVPRNW